MVLRYLATFTIFLCFLPSCSTHTKSRGLASDNSVVKNCETAISTIYKEKRADISLKDFDDYFSSELIGDKVYRLMSNSWSRYKNDLGVEELRVAMIDSYYKNESMNFNGFVDSNFRVFIEDKKVIINVPYVSIGNTSLGELSNGLNLKFTKFLSTIFKLFASFKEIDPGLESFEVNGISVQNPYLARNLNSYGFMIKGYDKVLPDDGRFIDMYKRMIDQALSEEFGTMESFSVTRYNPDEELIREVLDDSELDLSFYREFRFR